MGFSSISTGAFGNPEEDAAEVMMATLREELPGLSSVDLVRIVLWEESSYDVHCRAADDLHGEPEGA